MTRFAAVLMLAACTSRSPARPLPHDLDVATQPHATAPEAPVVTPPVASEPTAPAVAVVARPAPPAPPGVPDPATLERLGWPATTASFELRASAHVYGAPDMNGEPLGKIIIATRLPVGDSVAGDKQCKMWLAVTPAGWICARYARPSTRPPEATIQPEVPAGRVLPQDYFGIKKGAARYATEEDVRAGIARPEPKTVSTYMVTKDAKDRGLDIDGIAYVKTSAGIVASSDLYKLYPSTFTGVDLVKTPPPAWPFAWVVAANGRTAMTRATPDKKGAEAGTLAHRQLVPVLEESGAYVRVADGQWIDRASVRMARKRPRPAVDGAQARWIDLDRDEQVMIAYDGDVPVFATLFSSGRRQNDTPAALYRIRSKTAVTKMAAEEREASHYEVSEVPWATRFRSGLYFHAAYWHDQFGNPKSHGCVNLSPVDAKWVYDWTTPTMPAGWNELEVPVQGSMVVSVHDVKHPDPPVFDYDREAIERVKIRKQEKELKKKREEAEAAALAAPPTSSPAP